MPRLNIAATGFGFLGILFCVFGLIAATKNQSEWFTFTCIGLMFAVICGLVSAQALD
jgi:hypothetical protein